MCDTTIVPVPPAAWRRRFDEAPLRAWRARKLSLREFVNMLPLIVRVLRHVNRERAAGRPPVMETVAGLKITPDMGVPLGGLGGGTVTRGFRGDFIRWQMQAGMVHYGAVAADQFSLWAQRPAQPPQAMVLNPRPAPAAALTAWGWGLPAAKGTYYALFPRAWTVYEAPLPGLRLTCRQISPVIPHNYRESSFPVGVFVWTIENTADTEADVALMFTFQNGTGRKNDLAGGHRNRALREKDALGVELRHVHRQPRPGQKSAFFEDPLTFAIAAQADDAIHLTTCTRFVTSDAGAALWNDFATDGALEDNDDESPSAPGESIGAAVAARVHLLPGQTATLPFVLAWDMPIARFGWGSGWYRRYTRFYGREGNAATRIARDALQHYRAWEAQIEAWQQPLLDNPDLPDWYKSLLLNETYYLVDGGTIWTDGRLDDPPPFYPPLPEPEIGHFGYLESYEYRMYNTYDVHFYASFALAMLWPELELSLQRDFVHAIGVAHPETVITWFAGTKAARKVRGAVPHDLGSPVAAPWEQVNAYVMQDVSRWKDLNPKFVLQIYRDYALTGNREFLLEAWPAVRDAVAYMQRFDRDGDGLIENDNFPDQTYDTWTASGPSAYTGGLWLACLQAAASLATAVGERDLAAAYRQQFARARQAYESRLWNGEYYNYDASNSRYHDSIMADQLAGQWYARACGLEGIVPSDHARAALRKIFAFNVQKFHRGEAGALNGMRPDGTYDDSNLQALETWIGVTFALAACMLQEGLPEEALATARGVYWSIYRDLGLFFQTPEALDVNDVYRAVGYMRPLAVWAMQWALEGYPDRLAERARAEEGRA